jgi:outer membrane murein-binding lipoprotein Lpp
MKLANHSVLLCAVVASAGLLVLSGCEDNEARSRAGEAVGAINSLKADISNLNEQNEQMAKDLKTIREDLAAKIDARMDKLSDQLLKSAADTTDQMIKSTEKGRKASEDIVSNSRAELDKELKLAKSNMDQDIQKIRDEIKQANDELKKYMDNQLRELYPYAYQPKRLEPAAPPPPETK